MKTKELTEEEKKRRFWTVCKLPFFGLVEELRITNYWLVREELRNKTFDMLFGQFFCFAACMNRLLPGEKSFRAFFTQVAFATAMRLSRFEAEEIYSFMMECPPEFAYKLQKMNKEIIARHPDMPQSWLSKTRKTSRGRRDQETVQKPQ